jgi:hypothetical protein
MVVGSELQINPAQGKAALSYFGNTALSYGRGKADR